MKTKADPGPAGKGGPSERKMTLKEKAAFHIFEEVVVGVFRGKAIAQSLPAIGGGSLQGIVSVGALVFDSLIPFCAFREIGRVIGKRELWSLLLSRGTSVYILQLRPQE
jgi:hypothetical protein